MTINNVILTIQIILIFFTSSIVVATDQDSNTHDFLKVYQKALRLGLEYGNESVLLVYDVDNTLLATNQGLGSDQWYAWQRTLQKSGSNSPQMVAPNKRELLEIQAKLHALSGMHPPQDDLPRLVKDLQQRNFPSMVLTARGSAMRDSTKRELEKNAYQFTHSSPDPFDVHCIKQFFPSVYLSRSELEEFEIDDHMVSYGDGILMAAGQHKGAMLKIILELMQKKGHEYEAVIFVDDKEYNTTRLYDTVYEMGLDVYTYRYSREDNAVTNFDKNKAALQWGRLNELLEDTFHSGKTSDTGISSSVREDTVTRSMGVISARSSVRSESIEQSRSRANLSSRRILPDLSGDDLVEELREQFAPEDYKEYPAARDLMFGSIDNVNGRVRLVYTGESIQTTTTPDHTFVNTEHTFPQSRFKFGHRKEEMRSDLHHLFPTYSKVNSNRGSKAFGEIRDDETDQWWITNVKRSTIPTSNIDDYSESINSVFEPREDHKGNVARAMFYFATVYGDRQIDKFWFQGQIDTLVKWHKEDPVDSIEVARNNAIESHQGNFNPYILDSSLVERAFGQIDRRVSGSINLTLETEHSKNERIRIVSWNAKNLNHFSEVEERTAEGDFINFANDIKPDILILQEVTSEEIVNDVRGAMGLEGYESICSNFDHDDDDLRSLEVAILSRFPLTDVREFDPSPDNTDSEHPDFPLPDIDVEGIENLKDSRGFLSARIPDLNLIVNAVHLKSSRGSSGFSDMRNARKREYVAAAICAQAKLDRLKYPEDTIIVGGDFNTGETDQEKLGTDLDSDCYVDCDGRDGYDDTHAIFQRGLTGGPKLVSKTRNLGVETYRNSAFFGAGPIDCIYVLDGKEQLFTDARRSSGTFGSDHFAVWTDYVGFQSRRVVSEIQPQGMEIQTGELRGTTRLNHIVVGSWNIENLGKRGQHPKAIAEHLSMCGCHVVALQEIHDTNGSGATYENETLDDVMLEVNKSPGNLWQYRLFPLRDRTDTARLTGIMWNRAMVSMVGQPFPVNLRRDRHPNVWNRVPTGVKFSAGPGSTDIVVVSLHLKSNSKHSITDGSDPVDIRKMEADQLIEQLPNLIEKFNDKDIVFIGDFNCFDDGPALNHFKANGFSDLNADNVITYRSGSFNNSFDRVFVPLNQPEFKFATQYVAVPGSKSRHLNQLSDHYLIKTAIRVMDDDD